MAENFTTCVTCGNQYKVCKRCDGYESWRSTACTPRCYQVSATINQFFYNQIDAKQAKTQLENIRFDEIEHMTPDTEEWVLKILTEADAAAKQPTANAKKVAAKLPQH